MGGQGGDRMSEIAAKETQPKDDLITITVDFGKVLVKIKPDGAIERGEAFTTNDEASLQFWDVLANAFPKFLNGAIEKRIKEHLAEVGRLAQGLKLGTAH